MKIKNVMLLTLASVASLLTLTACGEGWEAVPYQGSVPYTEERTAGWGVMYVRAHMLPEKGPVLPLPAAIPAETVVIQDATPLFAGPQLKK